MHRRLLSLYTTCIGELECGNNILVCLFVCLSFLSVAITHFVTSQSTCSFFTSQPDVPYYAIPPDVQSSGDGHVDGIFVGVKRLSTRHLFLVRPADKPSS